MLFIPCLSLCFVPIYVLNSNAPEGKAYRHLLSIEYSAAPPVYGSMAGLVGGVKPGDCSWIRQMQTPMRDRFRAGAQRREIFLKKGKPDGQECAARLVLRFHIEYAMRNEWVCLRLSTLENAKGLF